MTTSQIGNNGYEELNRANLQNAINNQLGKNVATVIDNNDGTFTVKFKDRWYDVDSNGRVEKTVNWDLAMANAKAPESQDEERNNGVIGIGTDGNSVDMDLWEYELDEVTGGYGLNDGVSLTTNTSTEASSGYLGEEFSNINVPQYISVDNGVTWTAVTNMDWTFFNCTELVKVDKLPDKVTSMRHTFRGCSNLSECCELPRNLQNMLNTFYASGITSMPTIPESVNNMYSTFRECTRLTKTTTIPNGISDLKNTFRQCTSLKVAPNIPNSVKNMQYTFEGCTSLETASVIPSNVTNIIGVYQGCIKLRGNVEINATVMGEKIVGTDGYERVDYYRALYGATEEGLALTVTGTCKFIDEIIAQAENTRITIKVTE